MAACGQKSSLDSKDSLPQSRHSLAADLMRAWNVCFMLSSLPFYEAVIGDRHAVGVAAQIIERPLAVGKGLLNIDHHHGLARSPLKRECTRSRGSARAAVESLNRSALPLPARASSGPYLAELTKQGECKNTPCETESFSAPDLRRRR